MILKPILLLLFAIGISGCTTSYWHNPNKTQAQANSDVLRCEQTANQMYPVALVQRQTYAGYRGADYTECRPVGNTVQCYTTPGVYYPPRYETYDANRYVRINAYNTCMQSLGYVLKYKQIPLF